MKRQCQRLSPSGFTLLETLICIGIVVIVVAFIIPVISTTRRASNRTFCASSLHSIAQAFNIYSAQYHGYWPMVDYWYAGPGIADVFPNRTRHRRWFDYLSSTLGTPINVDGVSSNDFLAPAARKSVFWGCPVAPEEPDTFAYGMNPNPRGRSLLWRPHDEPMLTRFNQVGWENRFQRADSWQPAAARGLVADCASATLFATTVPWWRPDEPVPDFPSEFCNLILFVIARPAIAASARRPSTCFSSTAT